MVLPGFTTPEEFDLSAPVRDCGGKLAVAAGQRQDNVDGNIEACSSSLWWRPNCITMILWMLNQLRRRN